MRGLVGALGLFVVACGAGTMPARYHERPLLPPNDEHQFHLQVRAAGEADQVAEGAWRFGLTDDLYDVTIGTEFRWD